MQEIISAVNMEETKQATFTASAEYNQPENSEQKINGAEDPHEGGRAERIGQCDDQEKNAADYMHHIVEEVGVENGVRVAADDGI